jgi:transforming growth factor-beta-induced protein
MKKLFLGILTTVLSLSFSSCSDDDGYTPNPSGEIPNIVETAIDVDLLDSLVAALTKADEESSTNLIQTLSGDGPFTVFAPTNDAFTALFESLPGYNSLDDFDTDAEKLLLAQILSYHVLPSAVSSSMIQEGLTAQTVQGGELTFSLSGGVRISDATSEDARVLTPDVLTSNGIVHIIDKVLVPQEVLDVLLPQNTIVDIAVATESVSVLRDAVIKTFLADTLNGDGPFTVFAPTNTAFVALLNTLGDDYNSLDDFDTTEEIDLLKNILLYHVIPAEVKSTDLAEGEVETAFADNKIEVIASDNTFVIGDASEVNANIEAADIMASNGVIHLIDKVLLPQSALDFFSN